MKRGILPLIGSKKRKRNKTQNFFTYGFERWRVLFQMHFSDFKWNMVQKENAINTMENIRQMKLHVVTKNLTT